MQKLSVFKVLLNFLCIIMPGVVFADINTLYLQEGTAVLKGSAYNSRTLCTSMSFKQKYAGYVCEGSDGISLGKTVKETDIADQDYGLTFCLIKVPNADRTKCETATESNSVTHQCEAGYMSWKVLHLGDKDECVKCTDDVLKQALAVLPDNRKPYGDDITRYYCKGGTYKQAKSNDDRIPRGIGECLPVNNQKTSVSNAVHSGCIGDDLGECPPGAKLNPNTFICECMYGGTLSSDKTKCIGMKISKTSLKCGPEGCDAPLSAQCWTKITEAEYKECMGF